MKLFDRLTKKYKEIKDKTVKIYCCGPTVYNHQHIGNIRTSMMTGVLVEVLRNLFPKVIFTKNITDIDDKILQAAEKNQESPKVLSQRFYKHYLKVNRLLNIKKPDYSTKVSDYIPEIIKFIEGLLKKNKAYITEDGVYFDTNSIEYNFFENKTERISRIEELKKHNDKDFALWKFDNNNPNAINSPWGKGFCGWHIECSTMLYETLGEEIHIHCGGIDLAFPHHANEIAQSVGLFNKIPAKIWMHFNFLNIDNVKMSKSENNFIYAIDFLKEGKTLKDKKYLADVLRYMFLSSHYSKEIKFSKELVEESKIGLNKLREFYFQNSMDKEIKPNLSFLVEDFNTSETIDLLHQYAKNLNKNEFFALIKCLGFFMENRSYLKKEYIEKKILEREFLKNNKNYLKADKIRNFLLNKHIKIKDTTYNSKWFYI